MCLSAAAAAAAAAERTKPDTSSSNTQVKWIYPSILLLALDYVPGSVVSTLSVGHAHVLYFEYFIEGDPDPEKKIKPSFQLRLCRPLLVVMLLSRKKRRGNLTQQTHTSTHMQGSPKRYVPRQRNLDLLICCVYDAIISWPRPAERSLLFCKDIEGYRRGGTTGNICKTNIPV